MDETFQTLMPLENSASVYSIVYPGGVTSIEGQGSSQGEVDFLQFLLAQMTTTLDTNDQSVFQGLIPFQLPVNADQEGGKGDSQNTGETNAGSFNGTMPILNFLGEQGYIFPGSELLQQQVHNGESEAAVNLFEDNLFVGQGNNLSSENNQVEDVTFTANVSNASVVENTDGEGAQDNFFSNVSSKLSFSDVATMENESEKIVDGKTVVQNESSSDIGILVENKIRGSGESIIESVLNHAENEMMESDNLSLKQRVDLKNLDFVQLMREDYFRQPDENIVLNGSHQESAQILDYIQNTEENFKMNINLMDSYSTSSDLLNDAALQQGDNLESNFSFNYEQSSFHDAKDMINSNDLGDLEGSDKSQQVQMSEDDIKFQSALEGRIHQAQEAQSIAQQIIKFASLRSGDNFSEVKISLEPEYLGNLRLNIMVEDDAVFAKFIADNQYTRDLLSNNLAVLKDSLESSGIKLDDIEVSMEERNEGFDSFQYNSDATGDNTSESDEKFQKHYNSIYEYEEILENSQMNMPSVSSVTDGYHVNYLA